MSVLACGRVECDSIMCERLILYGSAYICDSCWQELLAYRETWPSEMSVRDVRGRIEDFLYNHPPGTFQSNKFEVDAEFRRLTESTNT